eukprot:COSAG01_NODE_273_length_19739_cov_90.981925_18_plen_96_part_00
MLPHTGAAQDGKDVPGEVQQPLPLYDVVRSYLGVAGWVGNHFQNTKYCVLEMMKGHSRITTAPVYQSHFIGALPVRTCYRTHLLSRLFGGNAGQY